MSTQPGPFAKRMGPIDRRARLGCEMQGRLTIRAGVGRPPVATEEAGSQQVCLRDLGRRDLVTERFVEQLES